MKTLFTNVRRGLALTTLLAAGTLAAQAQNVGIGTTAPDVSAALDIVSTSKGALLPRVASTAAVPTPATGLIVYQTGGTPGYYYNSGTPGAPIWQQFATAAGAAVTASNGLTKTGSNIALGGTLTGATTIAQAGNNFSLTGAGNVGIGTATPTSKLTVNLASEADQGLRVSDGTAVSNIVIQPLNGGNSGFQAINYNGYFNGAEFRYNTAKNRWRVGTDQRSGSDRFFVDTYDGTTGTTPLTIISNGNVGLGTLTPAAKLDVTGGSVKISTTGQGLIFPDGTTQTTAAISSALITASNGLTRTGNNIALGGTLTGATTIAQAGNNFSLTGGRMGIGTATPSNLLDLGDGFGATPSDPIAKKLAVYNDASFNFYGLGVSAGQLNLYASATPTTAPIMGLNANGNVGIGLGNVVPAVKLDVNGSVNIAGTNTLEFGAGVAGKEINAGKIGYQTFTPGALDIVGAGTTNANRRIRFFNEGGALFTGNVGIGSALPNNLLDLGDTFGATPSDPVAKKLAVYNNIPGNTFYGLGVSASQLNIYAAANTTAAPVMAFNANGNVGIGLGNAVPTSKLTVNLASEAEQGLRVSDGTNTSNIVIQPLNGGNSGFQAINFNGYFNGAEFRYNTAKNRWRVGTDQRSGSDRFFIDSYDGTAGFTSLSMLTNGNVGVGILAPAYKLEVAGDINAIGQVRANGVVLTSDARFKQQVRPLGGALAAVRALRGVRYTWNALGIEHGGQAGTEQVGVLAQELEKVFPELVSTGTDGYKAVNYAQLTPVLIEAIKEQQQQIEVLKSQNAALQGRTAQAEADHASLQTLQAQMARLLGETPPAGAQARK